MQKTDHTLRGILMMICAALSFAVMAVSAKACSAHLPASEIVFFRGLLGALLTAAVIARTRGPWDGKNRHMLIGRGVAGFLSLSLHFWSISKMDLGTAVMLNNTAPIFAVMLAGLKLGEKTTSHPRTALFVAFAGICLLTAPQLHAAPAAIGAGLLSGFFAAVVYVLIRNSTAEESALVIILYFTGISTVGALPWMCATGFVVPDARDCIGLAGLAASSLTGQLGLTYALKSAPVSTVSPFSYLSPVLSMLAGWWLFGEAPGVLQLAGSAVIIASGIYLYRMLQQDRKA